MTEEQGEYKIGDTTFPAFEVEEKDIVIKLNLLATHEEEQAKIQSNMNKLLDEVNVPEDVQAIFADGMKRVNEVENKYQPALKAHREQIAADLAKVVIPDEIKAALAEIDEQRNRIQEFDARQMAAIREQINNDRLELQASVQKQTHQSYADIAQRKADIEAEFAGKKQAVAANIEKLKAEIKADTKEIGYTVQGDRYQAIYVKGKKTWHPQRLEVYVEKHPDIKSCYDVGDPSITIRVK